MLRFLCGFWEIGRLKLPSMRFFSADTPFGVAPLSFEGYWLCAGWSLLIWGYNRQRVKGIWTNKL